MDTQNPKPGVFDPKANVKALIRIVVIVAILLGGVWLFVRFYAGQRAANRTVAAVLRQPIELKSATENIPVTSYKTFPLTLPYGGTLSVEVAVVNGNGLDVYLVEPNQVDNIKNNKSFTRFVDFSATKTKSYQRSGRMAQGDYFLVVLDTSLGILSKAATDVKIHVRLEP